MVQAKGIVLNEIRFQETSKILNIYTLELGKINIMAKGAYRPKSKIIAQTQPFSYCEYEIYKGRSWYYINEASIITSFYNIREQIERLIYGFFILELVNKSVPEEEVNENLFYLLEKTLSVLSEMKEGFLKFLIAFELKFISFLGYRPSLISCSNCNSKEIQLAKFSISTGGVICQNCLDVDRKSINISSDDIINLNKLMYSKLDELDNIIIEKKDLIKLQDLLEKYILYSIDRTSFDSLEMLKTIIND